MKRQSSGKRPPEAVTFFVDRSLGRRWVSEALRAAGEKAVAHDDIFEQDKPDEDWLRDVGARGWVVLSNDDRIRFRPWERQAILEGEVAAFILTSMGLKGEMMAEIFVKALPKIKRLLNKQDKPFVATLSRSGDVTLKQDWRKGL